MPAKSVAQRKLMAMAEHHPEDIYSENKGVLGMTKDELHKYASTKEKGLPMKKSGNALRNAVMGSSSAIVSVAKGKMKKKKGK